MGQHTPNGIQRRRGSLQTTANWDRARLDAVDWSNVPRSVGRVVHQAGTWVVVTCDKVQEACVYVSGSHRVIVINPATYRTLTLNPDAVGHMVRTMSGGANGMKFLAMDAGPYGVAARLEASRNAVVQADQLRELQQRAESLIVQASGLASGATPTQVRIFMERYGEIAQELENVEQKVIKLRALVDLAGDTVMATAS